MHGIIVLSSSRNGPRRPLPGGRRRKKISPFKTKSHKTLVLWLIFTVFLISALVLFFILLYLDLVLRDEKSKELAYVCGAFCVALLTVTRIWVSLPYENEDDVATRPGEAARNGGVQAHPARIQNELYLSQINSSIPDPRLYYPENQNLAIPTRNYQVREIPTWSEIKEGLPPAYSTLTIHSNSEPPDYEAAIKITADTQC